MLYGVFSNVKRCRGKLNTFSCKGCKPKKLEHSVNKQFDVKTNKPTNNRKQNQTKTKKTATTTRKGLEGIVLVVTSSKWSGLAMSLLIKICIEKLCQELDYVSLVDILVRIYFQFLCFMNSQSKQANSLNRIRYVCCLHYLSLSSTLLEFCIIFPYLALCQSSDILRHASLNPLWRFQFLRFSLAPFSHVQKIQYIT